MIVSCTELSNYGKCLYLFYNLCCVRESLTFNPFMPTVPTFAVRETDVSRHNGGTLGAPLKPLRDYSALRALSTLRGFRGHKWVKKCPLELTG